MALTAAGSGLYGFFCFVFFSAPVFSLKCTFVTRHVSAQRQSASIAQLSLSSILHHRLCAFAVVVVGAFFFFVVGTAVVVGVAVFVVVVVAHHSPSSSSLPLPRGRHRHRRCHCHRRRRRHCRCRCNDGCNDERRRTRNERASVGGDRTTNGETSTERPQNNTEIKNTKSTAI